MPIDGRASFGSEFIAVAPADARKRLAQRCDDEQNGRNVDAGHAGMAIGSSRNRRTRNRLQVRYSWPSPLLVQRCVSDEWAGKPPRGGYLVPAPTKM
jgi:hypothetical protein